MQAIWEELRNQVKRELPTKNFSLWINPLTLLEQRKETLIIGCPNKFSQNWISENYMPLMKEKLLQIGDGRYDIALKVQIPQKKPLKQNFDSDNGQLAFPSIRKNGNGSRRWLNDEFTFDRFVVGKCNEFAYSASKAVANGGSFPYSSLFLLSNTGLGKSHLSQAIGHTLLAQNPELKVNYVTAENFVNEMVYALRNNRIDEFKNKYRRCCDVLLLEEVHFLSGKEKTQLELGYTLDALENDHKKIIFTSSLLPKDIPNMATQLSSRIMSGIITSLERPDYETRVKIIEKKSIEQDINIAEEIVHYLAKHLDKDIRQIESSLSCLKAKSDLMKANINLDLTKDVLKCHISNRESISFEDIEKLVCQYFKVDPVMLRSKSRKKIHAYPRNIFIYLCRHHTNSTLEKIGRSIDRNHSTVVYASEVIEQKMKVHPQIRKQVHFLSQKLTQMMQ
ncbi:chromosomal replication initiator protein DnaA [Thermodesulfobacteriota bacterium]